MQETVITERLSSAWPLIGYAIVAIDAIRATIMAISSVRPENFLC